MRKRATDIPSAVSCHLQGVAVDGTRITEPYTISLATLTKQTENVSVHYPELNINRTNAVDYFEALPGVAILRWETHPKVVNFCDKYTRRFMHHLGAGLAYEVTCFDFERLLDSSGLVMDRGRTQGTFLTAAYSCTTTPSLSAIVTWSI